MNLQNELDLIWEDIKKNLLYLNDKQFQNDENYAINFTSWIKEISQKNKVISDNKDVKDKKDHETYKKYRQHVYWTNFGKNIGSEFNDYHFAVVIRESFYTALVIPISTEKENTPDWKIKENLIIPIGELNLPNERKPSYAMIHQIQAVSKKRLDRCGDKQSGYYEVELTDTQMNLIDEAIKRHFVNVNK